MLSVCTSISDYREKGSKKLGIIARENLNVDQTYLMKRVATLPHLHLPELKSFPINIGRESAKSLNSNHGI